MTTLIIAYAIISVLLITVIVMTEIIPSHVISLSIKSLITIALIIALAFFMLYLPTHNQKMEAVGDAVLVQRFNDADVYLDESNDMYFAVETNRWNPLEMYKHIDIPQALVYNKINQNGDNVKSDP